MADDDLSEKLLAALTDGAEALTDDEFDNYMTMPKRTFREFKTYKTLFERMRPFFRLKASRFPSGAQVGWTSSSASKVTWIGAPPVMGMAKMSQLPLRSSCQMTQLPLMAMPHNSCSRRNRRTLVTSSTARRWDWGRTILQRWRLRK